MIVGQSIKGEIELPSPYNLIHVLPPDMHGWFRGINKDYLTYFINHYNPRTIVELGSWLGASCLHMAEVSSPHTRIYAVDNWTAEGDMAIQGDSSVRAKIPILYQQFLSNVIARGFTEKIIPVRMDTKEAATALNITADLIYVDASHDEENVYTDIMAWYSKLNPGGIMCGDDYDCEAVERAVLRASQHCNAQVQGHGSFWYFFK